MRLCNNHTSNMYLITGHKCQQQLRGPAQLYAKLHIISEFEGLSHPVYPVRELPDPSPLLLLCPAHHKSQIISLRLQDILC